MDRRRHLSELDASRSEVRTWKRTAAAALLIDAALTARVATLDTREKTIVVPPVVSEAFWVKGGDVSPSYLDAMARWYAGLALTFSPATVKGQGETLLRYTDPEAHGAISARLAEDADRVSRTRISEVFYAAHSRVRPESLEVAIAGDLVTFVGEQTASTKHATYLVRFVSRDGQLSVVSFKEADNESDPFGDRLVPGDRHDAGLSAAAS